MTTSSCNVVPPTGPSAPAVTVHPLTVPITWGMRVIYHPLQRGPCGSGGQTGDWTPQPGWSAGPAQGRCHRDWSHTARWGHCTAPGKERAGPAGAHWHSVGGWIPSVPLGRSSSRTLATSSAARALGAAAPMGSWMNTGRLCAGPGSPLGAQSGAAFVPRRSAEASLAPGQGQAVSSIAAPRPPPAGGQPDPQHYVCHRTETERM